MYKSVASFPRRRVSPFTLWGEGRIRGRKWILAFARMTVIALALVTSQAPAQSYPSKPIRLMIGYTAGGSAEAGARPLARALEALLGQPVVFEYRPGNAGGVAMEAIAKAPADGYTLYYFDSGPLTVAPHIGKVGYDNIKSFTHLGHVCGSGSMLVVHPSTPFKSVACCGFETVSLNVRVAAPGAFTWVWIVTLPVRLPLPAAIVAVPLPPS